MVDVLKQAVKLVEPTTKEKEQVDSVARRSFELVKRVSGKFDGVLDVAFGGSYAKGTWLRGDVDVDIFVKIQPGVSEERFEKIGREMGFQALRAYRPYLRYSQHPYVEAIVDGIKINVVPCYDVERGRWISAADRSPYHTRFIIDYFDEGKRREARLLKRFMKTIGVYGAEIASAGFSGYVCEVLILKYGSFIDVLKAAAGFSENQVISIEDKIDMDVASLFKSALVILDPVDQKRNLGTAISHESVGRMILASRRFLKKPGLGYFAGNGVAAAGRRGKGRGGRLQTSRLGDNVVVVRFRHRKRSQDIIWGQLKSSMNAVTKQLGIHGFKVIRSGCGTDELESSAFVFMLESVRLPRLTVKQGPKVFGEGNSIRFLEKNRASNLLWAGSDARIMALVDNRFTDATVFLKSLLTKNLGTSGVSKGLIKDMKRYGVEICAGKKMGRIRETFIREVIGDLVTTDQFAFGTYKRAG